MTKASAPTRLAILALFGAAIGAFPSRAIQLPGPDVPALLRVNSVLRTSFGQFVQDDHRQILISRGGGVLELLATAGPSGPRAFFIRAFRGLGTSDQLATLGQALVNGRVGVQSDCTLGGNPGQVEVTWYGRTGRLNTFRVTFLAGGTPPGGIQCSAEVVQILDAIERFVTDAGSNLPQD